MAIAGRKPKPPALKLILGNPGRRPVNTAAPRGKGRPSPPTPLTGRAAKLWRRYIAGCTWLSASDSFTAYAFVTLAAEFIEAPADMQAARIANMRALASSLGLDPSSRARMAVDEPDPDSSTAAYFKPQGQPARQR